MSLEVRLKLIGLMAKAGYPTQRELAKACGLSEPTVCWFMLGRHKVRPRERSVAALASGLGVSTDELWGILGNGGGSK